MSIRSILYLASGDAPIHTKNAATSREVLMVPRRGGLLALMTDPVSLPHWLTEADVDFYVNEFTRTGFGSALTWYRNIDRSWELLAPFTGRL